MQKSMKVVSLGSLQAEYNDGDRSNVYGHC